MKGKKTVHPDGHVTYYYYVKKAGRHKKPGPKKKPKKRGAKTARPWDYKIIRFDFRKQKAFIGYYHDLEEVEYVRKILEERNREVVFPKTQINNGRNNRQIYENKSEYVVLKKIRDVEKESAVTKLRNEYGTFVEHKTTSKNWAVYDKFPCIEEETFWVYGHNPKCDRKTFSWIYNNLICLPAEEEFVFVYLYNNKVIIKYDGDFAFVICKNTSDAIRFYNLVEEKSKKNKTIVLTGFTRGKSRRAVETIKMIAEKTNWELTKIQRTTTRA